MLKKFLVVAVGLISAANVTFAQPATPPAVASVQQAEPDKVGFYVMETGTSEEAVYFEIRGDQVTGYFAKGQHFEMKGRLVAKDRIEGFFDVKGKQEAFTMTSKSNGHLVLHAFDMDLPMKKGTLPTTRPVGT